MRKLSLSEAHSLAQDFAAVQNCSLKEGALVSLWTVAELEAELNSPLSLRFHNELGFILYRLDGDQIAQVMHLAVRDKGQRHFSRLWTSFERQLLEQGVSQVFLEAKESSSAEKAYLACGFGRQALRKNYYKDGANAWVMTKTLGV
jgi:ribosomal-protein-alanine N-acetyltransferase